MPRGRPRKSPANLPAHIDYVRVPKGLYWDPSGGGRWYVREARPEGGTSAKTVASAEARLSDLHAIAEARAGAPGKGTVAFVLDVFHASLEYRALAASTREHYRQYAAAIKAYPTKRGPFGEQLVDRLGPPVIRALVHGIAMGRPESRPGAGDGVPGYPTKANHWLRYLRRAFGVGVELGACRTNPARGIKQVREKADARMPGRDVFRQVQSWAREASQKAGREKGKQPVYLWCAMELAYQARLRGIEVLTLHDGQIDALMADSEAPRLVTQRRKGSRDNAVRVGSRMREAIEALQAHRAAVWARRGIPTPIRPEARPLFVSEDGTRLTRAGFNTSWGKLMRRAIADGVIQATDRFGLHGLKHRGVTDTKGTPDVKKQASGHVTDAMAHLYDHDVPLVEPADDA